MCGIAGIFSLSGKNISNKLVTMLNSMKHRGPDGVGILVNDEIVKFTNLDKALNNLDLKGNLGIGHVRLAIVGGHGYNQPLQDCRKGISVVHNGEIYNYQNLKKRLQNKHFFETKTDSEVIPHLIEQYYTGDLSSAFVKAIELLDGVYSIVAYDGNQIVLARDKLGVRQLYFGRDNEVVAFASERKALWKIGLTDIRRVPPGSVSIITNEGIKIISKSTLPFRKPTISSLSEALGEYVSSLRESVLKRIQGLDNVGIIFSGGVDSVLIAQIAKNLGANITCYVSGMRNSKDVEYAVKAAKDLGYSYRVKTLDDSDIETLLPEIIEAIEDRAFLQVEVAIPIFEAVKMAHADGCKVVLTGQAADELFAGYTWYRKIADIEGYDRLNERMLDDISRLYKETLEREDKIAMWHSVEMRVPYLDSVLVSSVTAIDPRLKLPLNDKLGKRVHREVAMLLGIPPKYCMRSKDAAQHGSGIHDAIKRIASKNGFSDKLVSNSGYSPEDFENEKLGSSHRYGYKYDKTAIWQISDNIQMYLDHIAMKNGLIEPQYKKEIEAYLYHIK